MTAILVDTNVLVYAYDIGEPGKQALAMDLLEQLKISGQACLSAQCLGEFFSALTRGPAPRLASADAAAQTELLANSFPVLNLTPLIVLEAIRGARAHQLSYYDAQIWAAARMNQMAFIFSEDFQDGLSLDGVKFVNPVSNRFKLEEWI
jgi:predicted nucleic acid-binding protein